MLTVPQSRQYLQNLHVPDLHCVPDQHGGRRLLCGGAGAAANDIAAAGWPC